MKKVGFFIVSILIIFLFILFAKAQIPDPDQLKNDMIVKGVEDLQELKWDYISQKWKTQFLKNKYIAKFDNFFKKINFLFVILFARNYDLSFELLLAIILWVVVAIAIEGYIKEGIFVINNNFKPIIAICSAVILAHIQLFNLLSGWAFKLVFYKSEWYWKTISLIIIFAVIFIFYKLNKMFEKSLKKGHEEARIKNLEEEEKKHQAYQRGARSEFD